MFSGAGTIDESESSLLVLEQEAAFRLETVVASDSSGAALIPLESSSNFFNLSKKFLFGERLSTGDEIPIEADGDG